MKESAISFLQLAASGKVLQAFEQYVGPGFKHHNPYFKADAVSMRDAMQENAALHPDKVFEVQRALQDGELVAVHSKIKFSGKPQVIAAVHIFRFDAGKIVELWDIGQPVPEQCPNEIGMF